MLPLVADGLYFLLFLTSRKQRLDACSDLFASCMYGMYYPAHSIRSSFNDNMELHISELRNYMQTFVAFDFLK